MTGSPSSCYNFDAKVHVYTFGKSLICLVHIGSYSTCKQTNFSEHEGWNVTIWGCSTVYHHQWNFEFGIISNKAQLSCEYICLNFKVKWITIPSTLKTPPQGHPKKKKLWFMSWPTGRNCMCLNKTGCKEDVRTGCEEDLRLRVHSFSAEIVLNKHNNSLFFFCCI